MRAIRKLNNNAVVCMDSQGRQVVAMGKGVGFGPVPRDVSLAEIERTFYDIDDAEQNIMRDIPTDVVLFAAKFLDIARSELPYELRPNAVLTLADHIAFAIERIRKNISVRMPLAYDVQQMYPMEYKLGEHAVAQIRREFKLMLPDEETVGIALNLINAKAKSKAAPEMARSNDIKGMIEQSTRMVEDMFHITVDRESFSFARYATHLQYLFQRVRQQKAFDTENLRLYKDLREEFPAIAVCAERVSAYIEQKWDCSISGEEKMYLILHINRIRAKESL